MQWYCHKLHWSEQWYIKRRIQSHNVITHYISRLCEVDKIDLKTIVLSFDVQK